MTDSGPDFVSLQVRNLIASAAFYEKFLGFVRQDGPPHAIVFDTVPAAFAVREPVPGVDLEEIGADRRPRLQGLQDVRDERPRGSGRLKLPRAQDLDHDSLRVQ